MFFNLCIVSKSLTEISTPIGTVLELRSHDNLPRLVKLALSLSQFVLFLHVIPDKLDDDQIRSLCGALKSHWIITINGKINVWKCKLIFPNDTLQQKIEITDLKPLLAAENTSVLIILPTTVYSLKCPSSSHISHMHCMFLFAP